MPPQRVWIDLAKKRIRSVLSTRLYANIRQLESKISESGPTNQLCNPHIISQALRDLQSEDIIVKEGHFYFLVAHTKTPLKRAYLDQRKKRIIPIYEKYLHLTQRVPDACGSVLEDVLNFAISNSQNYQELGSKAHPLINFGATRLPGPLDNISILGTDSGSFIVCFEAKNIREWIYGEARELWSLINKANCLSASSIKPLPILICRKIPWYTRHAFEHLGVLGFENHRQIFNPLYADQLVDIRHKDELGFHDITTETEPSPALYNFLQSIIPAQAEKYSNTFVSNKSLFDEVAPRLALKELNWAERRALWTKVKKELGIFDSMGQEE